MTTTALIGVAGGVGTTRTAVEFAAALARDGRSVVVIDAAYATQGLGEYVSGRIDTDVTTLATDPSVDLADATYPLAALDTAGEPADESAGPGKTPRVGDTVETTGDSTAATSGSRSNASQPGADNEATDDTGSEPNGQAVAVPARAAFERLARAKTVEASQRLASRIERADERFDHVLVDVPPVAANPAVAAVTTADRRVAVAPGTQHGADARRRLADRLADLDTTLESTVAVESPLPAADAVVPTLPSSVTNAPTVTDDGSLAGEITDAAENALGVSLAVDPEPDGPLGRVRERITDSA